MRTRKLRRTFLAPAIVAALALIGPLSLATPPAALAAPRLAPSALPIPIPIPIPLTRIWVTPSVGPPTTTTTASGTHFGTTWAGICCVTEHVNIYFDNTLVAIGITNSYGNFSGTSFQVPSWATPGNHTITAIGVSSGKSAHTTFLVQTDWAQFRDDPSHSGLNPYENVLNPANVFRLGSDWTAPTGSSIYSSPAVANGVVYVGALGNNLYAFNASTGAQLWTATTGGRIYFSSPAVADGVVYVGSEDNKLYAFNASTGAQLWTANTGGSITMSSPAVADGVVYVGSDDGNLYAFNASTGAQLWAFPTAGVVAASPAVANGMVYVSSFAAGIFYAVNASTGAQVWSAPIGPGYGARSSPAVTNGVVYVGSEDGTLYTFNATTGAQLWTAAIGPIDSGPAVANGVVYVSSDNDNLYALNASTGAQLWTATAGGQLTESSPAVANGVVYVGSNDITATGVLVTGKLYAFNASTGAQLWTGTVTTGSSIYSSPAVANGVVYVGSDDSKLYAYHLLPT